MQEIILHFSSSSGLLSCRWRQREWSGQTTNRVILNLKVANVLDKVRILMETFHKIFHVIVRENRYLIFFFRDNKNEKQRSKNCDTAVTWYWYIWYRELISRGAKSKIYLTMTRIISMLINNYTFELHLNSSSSIWHAH